MAKEIERKFLVASDGWRKQASKPARIRQGYLSRDRARVVRVRTKDKRAFLTIKSVSAGASALARSEFEYEIPFDDAVQLLDQVCVPPVITKDRFRVPAGGNLQWEIDVFVSPHPDFVLAEIELPDENTAFERPAWVGREVTDDPRYENANIGTAKLD